MSRKATATDDELIEKLAKTFTDYGYDGASLTILSAATGLQRASLYHRFPGGKEEMAARVLGVINAMVTKAIVEPLKDEEVPFESKISYLIEQFNQLYRGGKDSCVLNMLAHPLDDQGPFSDAIKAIYRNLIEAIATAIQSNGVSKAEAEQRTTTILTLLQGGLVVSRGTGTTEPFKNALGEIEKYLLLSAKVKETETGV
jgi:TetR/AcrR family transcriptional repressor of lmrAB and yxaGH operons